MDTLLYLFFIFLPFNFALNPAESIDLPIVRIIIGILFGLFFVKSLLKKDFTINTSFGGLFLVFWFIWMSLSFIWAMNPVWSYRKVIFLVNFLLFFVILSFQSRSTLEKAINGYVVGAIIISGVALIQSFSQLFIDTGIILQFWTENILPFFLGQSFAASVKEYPSLLVNILGKTYFRATAFFPDPHIFSYYLAMALPIAFFSESKGRFYRGGFWFLLAAILLSFSRGSYVGLGMCLIWFTVITFLAKRNTKIAFQAIVGLFLMSFIFISPIGPRFLSSFSSEDGSKTERVRLFTEALHFIKERPALGVGLGNYPLLVKPEALNREPIYAHNLYLDIATETGLIGLLLFLVTIFWALFTSYQKWLHLNINLYLGVHLSLFYFLVHSLFEAPLFSVHILPVILLILSYCFHQSKEKDVIVDKV